MAVIEIYGEQVTILEQPAAPLQVTDTSETPFVLRQFPIGEYFSRVAGWLPATARGIARFLSRLRRRQRVFVKQFDPRTADELLPEYESAYGLEPTGDQSLDDRRDALLTKMRSLGGVNAEAIQQLAIDFGYLDAVVTDAADPFTTESLCDDFLMGGEWKLTLKLTAISQGATRDSLLEELIRAALLEGWYAIFEFT